LKHCPQDAAELLGYGPLAMEVRKQALGEVKQLTPFEGIADQPEPGEWIHTSPPGGPP
jgi:hypothetical protein